MSVAGPKEWANDPNTWKGVIPNVYGGGTLILTDPNKAEADTVQFWKDYSNAMAENVRKAVLAKGQWVSNGKCTGKYALSCVEGLWKATFPFIQALNKINNHDTTTHCCKHQSNNPRDDSDASGIDLFTFVRALQLASDLESVDPVDDVDTHGATDQDPDTTPSED